LRPHQTYGDANQALNQSLVFVDTGPRQ